MISVGDMGVFRGEFKFAQVQNGRVSIIIVWDGSAPDTKNRNMVKDLTDANTIMASICNSLVQQDIVLIDGQCIFVNQDGEKTCVEIEISCLADLALVHLAYTCETVVRIIDDAVFCNGQAILGQMATVYAASYERAGTTVLVDHIPYHDPVKIVARLHHNDFLIELLENQFERVEQVDKPDTVVEHKKKKVQESKRKTDRPMFDIDAELAFVPNFLHAIDSARSPLQIVPLNF